MRCFKKSVATVKIVFCDPDHIALANNAQIFSD